MSIAMPCPRCKAAIEVKDSLAGKSTMCAECGTFVDIPEPGQRVVVARPVPKEEPDELSPRELKRMIRDAFVDNIPRVWRTPGYRIAALLVAAAMLFLVAFYIGLLVFLVVFLCWHATQNLDVFRNYGIGAGLLIYLAPLIIGPIMLAFLVKPLLARRPRSRGGRPVNLDREPVLVAFVNEIAKAVHAPAPNQIAVDAHVNASASFGSGLSGLFGHKLTLTIGLPLIGALNARQLAGVIAHELGHFSQGAGTRLNYMIRSINGWFHRLVYERDNFDETLKEWGEENNIAGAIVFVAHGCVMMTRGVLWLFMTTGHMLSCFLVRRMEYDADRSEARLVGARVFESTFYRLAILGAAHEQAVEIVRDCWLKDTYPDDFATLVIGLAERMSERDCREAEEKLEDATTGLFDDHPSFSDRLASVQQENPKSVFRLDLPISEIFRPKAKLVEAASLDMYRTILGRGLRPHGYRPAGEYLNRGRS